MNLKWIGNLCLTCFIIINRITKSFNVRAYAGAFQQNQTWIRLRESNIQLQGEKAEGRIWNA